MNDVISVIALVWRRYTWFFSRCWFFSYVQTFDALPSWVFMRTHVFNLLYISFYLVVLYRYLSTSSYIFISTKFEADSIFLNLSRTYKPTIFPHTKFRADAKMWHWTKCTGKGRSLQAQKFNHIFLNSMKKHEIFFF